ncbi:MULTISPECIES: hypothetical protein [Streptomyces]|uniref:Uncharacterized protein n=1 Tax=Streptomyces qinglanensis TaxID=943816 RepID=A0A1E7K1M3_9ACTN|nr:MULTISPECIES: hypothetical protein [Streptomyces]MBE9498919.1 hypothetical protein [Streptomyces sp. GKU 257-1]OEU97755.1 hypothetical protein AN217_07680 [Streptomyces qinglanensis]OEV13143.1 hypothetical protein AN220_29670 [Streptomyces nanshensis]
MAASAELLISALTPLPQQRTLSKRGHEPVDLSGVSDPDSGLDGSCICGCADAPLTSEPPLADVAPLTSEPPLAEAPLTSEPAGVGFGTEPAEI